LVYSGYAGTFKGLWAYDVPAIGMKHSYDLHDLILTIEWFSEAFRTWSLNPYAEKREVVMPKKYMDSDSHKEDKTILIKPSDWFGDHEINLDDMIDGELRGEIGSIPVCYLAEITPWETSHWGQLTSEMELPADPLNPLCSGMFGNSATGTYTDDTVSSRPTVRAAVLSLNTDTLRAVNATLSHAEAHGDLEQYEDNVHTSELYRCYVENVLLPLVSDSMDSYNALVDGIAESMDFIDEVCNTVWEDIAAYGCDVCFGGDVDSLWAPTSPTATYVDPMTGWDNLFDGFEGPTSLS